MGKRVALGIGVLVLALAFLPGIRRLWDPGSQAPSESLVVDVVPAGRASIPPEFDGTKGWGLVSGSSGPGLMAPVVVPRAGVVVFHVLERTSYLVARDVTTGAPRWTTAPVPFPSGAVTGQSAALVEKGGKEYAFMSIADTKAAQTHLYVYAAASQGDQVTPTREIVFPGARLTYSAYGDGQLVVRQDGATYLVDVTTGQSTTYPDQGAALRPPQPCGGCEDHDQVIGMTPSGPLVQGTGAFWVPGAWLAADADFAVTGLPDGQVLAASPTSGSALWTLRDPHTGRIQASVTCRAPKVAHGGTLDYSSSSDGRYVISGGVGFDLQAHQGFCFQQPASSGETDLATVDTTGTAYGTAQGQHVSASLNTGKVSPLPDAVLPDYVGGDVAILGRTTSSGEIQVYPRAR